MSNTKTTSTDPKAAKRAKNTDTVLDLATSTAKGELGDATNKSVTAAATLNVSVTENDTTEDNGHNASVTIGVTSSTTSNAKK